MKNFLENNVQNIDDIILDFVDSEAFKILNIILTQKYIGSLQIFHNKSESSDIIKAKAYLDALLTLCTDLEMDRDRILSERKKESQVQGLE